MKVGDVTGDGIKETWALISIMVYAFVIHSRFVPALRGKWMFNLMSMFAFVAILFTYYGKLSLGRITLLWQ
jgi:ABC-type transport system involved in cytochrome c biogenesis permease subunit